MTNQLLDVTADEALSGEVNSAPDNENKGAETLMDIVVKDSLTPPTPGKLVEGTVIGHGKLSLFIDLGPVGTGIIFWKEYLNARDVIRKTNPGDQISAKVIAGENEDGYIELSLQEARQAAVWKEAD